MSWVITAVVVGTVAVGSLGYSAYSSYTATEDEKDQAKLLARREKSNREQAAFRLQKQRGVVGQEPGLRDTILTGPLGIPGQGNTGGGKTLLGQ